MLVPGMADRHSKLNGGEGQPQSQYFQSFDASHVTPPPSRPPVYTAQQKDEAVRLLNDGTPAKKIAEHIGGTCSKSNPYRWRAEEIERERQVAAERRRAREEFLRTLWDLVILIIRLNWQLIRLIVFIIWVFWADPFLFEFLIYYVADIIGVIRVVTQFHERPRLLLTVLWICNVWKISLVVYVITFLPPPHVFLRLYKFNVMVLWITIAVIYFQDGGFISTFNKLASPFIL